MRGLLPTRPAAKPKVTSRTIAPPPPSPRHFDPAEMASMNIRSEYRSLDAAIVQAQKQFFENRARYISNNSARQRFIRELHSKVDGTSRTVMQTYTTEAAKVYQESARATLPGFTMGDIEESQLRKLQLEGAQAVKKISDYTKRDVNKFIARDSPAYKISADKGDAFIRNEGIKGMRFEANGARQTVGNYADMVFRSNFSRLRNAGVLAAARQGNIEVVEVRDGSECGWSFHRDSDKANGKIVTIQDAEEFPLAHPHCQRTFFIRPELRRKDAEERQLSSVQKAAIAGAAAVTTASVLGLAIDMNAGRIQSMLRAAGKQNLRWELYEHRLRQEKRKFEQYAKFMQPADLYDFLTKMPIVETPEQLSYYFDLAKRNVQKMADADLQTFASIISSYGEALWRGEEMPLFIRQFFNLDADVSRKVIGDHFKDFAEFEAWRYKYNNMTFTQTIGEFFDLRQATENKFFSWIGQRGPSFARFSFPRVGGQRYGRFSSVDPSGFVKETRTSGKHGIINRLTFNHNGLLRAGFVRDPKTGRISPNFRLIPKGPIRIFTEVNRSPKTGKVNSVTAILRIVTQAPVNYEARMNISLRALNITNAEDILKLTMADFKRLRMDPKFFTFVSNAAELRLRGPRLGFGRWMTTFDFSHVFRMKWEEARYIFNMTTVYLQDQLGKWQQALRTFLVKGVGDPNWGDLDWESVGVDPLQFQALPDNQKAVTLKDIINRILTALGFKEQPNAQ